MSSTKSLNLGYSNEAFDSLYKKAKLSRKQIYKILPNNLKNLIKKALETGEAMSYLEVRVDSRIFSYTLVPVVENNYLNLYGRDITKRKEAEKRQNLATQILELLNQSYKMTDKIRNILCLIKEFTGFEAVGIRLNEGVDFPYYETKGFPVDFVEAERYLCARNQVGELIRDSKGNPYLECMCGNVICGRTNPSLPFFTENGSFWTNSTTDFLASTLEEDRQVHTLNHCNSQGYESVALIPLNCNGGIIGLLQLNDSRKEMFTLETINFFEKIGSSIGIAFMREQSTKALNAFSEKYRSFVQNFHGIAFYRYVNFEPIFFHGAIEEITGYTENDFITEKIRWDQIIYPDDLSFLHETFEKIHSIPKHSFEIDYRILCKNRQIKYVHEYAQNICDDSGKPIIVRGAIYNITEQKEAEEALKESEEKFRLAFENANMGMCLIDLDGNLQRVNTRMCEIFGYSKEELEHMNVNTISHPEDVYISLEFINSALSEKYDYAKYEKRFVSKQGQNISGQVSISLVRDSQGNPLYFVSQVEDITESKRAEMQLREDKEKLRSLALELSTSEDRERRRIAEYLHDMISQALVVIRIKLGILQNLKDPEPATVLNREIRELLENAIESTRSVTFDLSSPVLDKLGFEPAAESLCEKITNDHGLAVDFSCDSRSITLDDDMKRFLYRSVRELLMNVVKHANAHSVKVSVRRKKGMLCITVDDDGDGFRETLVDNRYMERRFGLFSIRERLNYIGGRMEIDSKPGRGTRVSLYVPLGGE